MSYFISVEEKCWHRANTLCSSCILALIHIHFQENGSWIFIGQLFKVWCDSLAWTTPIDTQITFIVYAFILSDYLIF